MMAQIFDELAIGLGKFLKSTNWRLFLKNFQFVKVISVVTVCNYNVYRLPKFQPTVHRYHNIAYLSL